MAREGEDRRIGTRMIREAFYTLDTGVSDRWPARGLTGQPSRDYRPLEDVAREGNRVPYRKYGAGETQTPMRTPNSPDAIAEQRLGGPEPTGRWPTR